MSTNFTSHKQESHGLDFSSFKAKYPSPYGPSSLPLVKRYPQNKCACDHHPEDFDYNSQSIQTNDTYSTAFSSQDSNYNKIYLKSGGQKRYNFDDIDDFTYESSIQKKVCSNFSKKIEPSFEHYNTINFSNINSLTHFQKKLEESKKTHPPPFDSGYTSVTTKTSENFNFMNDSREIDDLNNEDSINSKRCRSDRGLKYLSVKVKEFVLLNKQTTYRELAEKLIGELRFKEKALLECPKDEQNVKRRVYDALNVLIATDLFKKKGKTVFYDGSTNLLGHEMLNKKFISEKEELLIKIEKKKQMLKKKKEALQSLLLKNLAVKNLMNRNYQTLISEKPYRDLTEKEIDIVNSFKNKEHFSFPFLILEISDNAMTIKMNKAKNIMNVSSNIPLKIYGDMDVLIKLNWHKVSHNMIEKWFPKEVIHYLPQSN